MISVIFGKCGSGKSFFCKKVVKDSILPVVVFDTMDEYQGLAVKMKITDDLRFDNFKVRFTPRDELEFAIANRLVANLRTRFGLNVIYDEIDFWTNPHFLPVEFLNNLRYSRHYGLNIYATARNPSEVHKKITGLANRFIIFKITEPLYLDYFRRFNPALPGIIADLKEKNHEYYEYELNT